MNRNHYYTCLGTYLQLVFISLYTLKLILIWILKNTFTSIKIKLMSRDVKILNQWFVSVESCVKQKLWLFVPSDLMLCVLLCVEASANILWVLYKFIFFQNAYIPKEARVFFLVLPLLLGLGIC
jgi:hypothetical protein